MTQQLEIFPSENPNSQKENSKKVVNVASVPQRSPFRYPGGKTWFVPFFRQWMSQFQAQEIQLIEPFAGGGIVSLTTAFENLAKQIIMAELDEEVAAVWQTILSEENEWLAKAIYHFELNLANVQSELAKPNKSVKEKAFCTILKNRILHGGILAKGSGLIKKGENGKGLSSRWYPKTLRDRILAINQVHHKMEFTKADAFDVIVQHRDNLQAVFFIDPPYTVAGRRLYTHFEIDHEKLFRALRQIEGYFLMTYDDTEEVRAWAEKYEFPYQSIPMKTTHHRQKYELVISNKFTTN